MNSQIRTADQHTLGAAANKLRTLANEILRDIGQLLESLRHDGRIEELKNYEKIKRSLKGD